MIREPDARVRYFPNQSLRTKDFVDEQKYHAQQIAFHRYGHHTRGILTGLNIDYETDGRRFVIRPGLAVAGDGTCIEFPVQRPVSVERFDDLGVDRLAVYLEYVDEEAPSLPSGYARCAMPGDGTSDRVKIRPVINVVRDDLSVFSDADRRSIYLGRLRREFAKPIEERYVVDDEKREYVGLRSSRILSPSGLAAIEIGLRNTSPDTRRFAVLVHKTKNGEDDCPKDDALEPALLIRNDRSMEIDGDLSVTGDLRLQNGTLAFDMPTVAKTKPAGKLEPRHWTMYQYERSDGIREFRIELPPAEKEKEAQVVIGSFPADGKEFQPIMTISNRSVKGTSVNEDGDTVVDDDTPAHWGQVTIHGDLFVEGAISGRREEPTLGEQARTLLYSGTLVNAGDANALIEAFNKVRFSSDLEDIIILLKRADGPGTIVDAIRVAENEAGVFQDVIKAIFDSDIDTDFTKTLLVIIPDAGDGFFDELVAALLNRANAKGKLDDLAVKMFAHGSGTAAIAGSLPNDSAKIKLLTEAILLDGTGRAGAIEAIESQHAVFKLLVHDLVASDPQSDAVSNAINELVADVDTRKKIVEEIVAQITVTADIKALGVLFEQAAPDAAWLTAFTDGLIPPP